jgi:hypothetical protein
LRYLLEGRFQIGGGMTADRIGNTLN